MLFDKILFSRVLLIYYLIIFLGCSSNRLIESEHNPYLYTELLSQKDIGKKAKIIEKNDARWIGNIIYLDEESITIDRDKQEQQKNIRYDQIKKIVVTDENYNLAVVFAVLIGATIILVGGSYLIIK